MSVVADYSSPGALMRLVAGRLEARDYRCEIAACEEERWISVPCHGGRCYLLVWDEGLVEWECVPQAGSEADPKTAADIAAFLLTGKGDSSPREDGISHGDGLSFKGIVGTELRARGFNVGLEVYEDTGTFTVASEILVTNPVVHPNSSVRISDEGAISWECDYPCEITATACAPYCAGVVAEPARLADSIVSTVTHAMSLLPGLHGGEG